MLEDTRIAVSKAMSSQSVIRVNISIMPSMNTPSVDFMWAGHRNGNGKHQKWGYDKDFDFGEIIQCGDFIAEDMRSFIDDVIAKKNAVSDKTAE